MSCCCDINKWAEKLPFSGINVMNWGMGILFVWGGVEKFVKDFGIGLAGFPGGVGLDGMSGFLIEDGGTKDLMLCRDVEK